MNYKYSILTFIIGKGYEKIHEIENKQDDVEYLLITDDSELKSETWNVVYDENLLKYNTPFERCFRIRYNVFNYCSTNTCVTIDGSMQVKGSLDKLIYNFDQGNYDICLMPHPLQNDLYSEYNAWIRMRNYPLEQAQRAIKWLENKKYDFKYKGLFQLCFSIKRNTFLTSEIDRMTLNALDELSKDSIYERLDQTIFTYIMNSTFSYVNILPISEQVVRSYAIQWYWHNSDKPNMNIFYDINKPDIKWMFNKQVECEYLK